MPRERERRILIAATSSKIEPEDIKHLEATYGILAQAGIQLLVGKLDQVDEADLGKLVKGASVLWSLKGGYGVHRLDLNQLVAKLAKTGCIPAGYSDNDLINLKISANNYKLWAYYCLHAGWADTWAVESVQQTLKLFETGKAPEITSEKMTAVIRPGEAKGVLLAAGIAQMVEFMAINGHKPLPDDIILMLDDNDQAWTKHTRDLWVLLRNGKLRGRVRGIVMGRRVDMHGEENMNSETDALGEYELVMRKLYPFGGGPIMGVWPNFGHAEDLDDGARFVPLIMGKTAEIEISDEGKFSLRYT